MKMTKFLLVLALLASTNLATAQTDGQAEGNSKRPVPNGFGPGNGGDKETFMTHEQMTSKMITDLKLNEKQAKKIKKLNKKYASIIEGPQRSQANKGKQGNSGNAPQGGPGGNMGGGMMGGPGGNMGGGMMGGAPGGGPGGNMGGGMMGGPGGGPQGQRPQGMGQSDDDSMDLSGKKMAKYEKKLKSILTDSQYEGFEKIRPKFASQIMVKRFLLGQ
jgi:hypothetical protein